MGRMISNDVVERMKVLDKYIEVNCYSIIVICSSPDIMQYVFSQVVRKCVLLNKCLYTMIPEVTSGGEIMCLEDTIEHGNNFIIGAKPSFYKESIKGMLKDKSYIVMHVDQAGMDAKVYKKGE